jgi:hypothetical protein
MEEKNENVGNGNNVERDVMKILCVFKLMIIKRVYGVWMCYHAYS